MTVENPQEMEPELVESVEVTAPETIEQETIESEPSESSTEPREPSRAEKRIHRLTKQLREQEQLIKQYQSSSKVSEIVESKAPSVPPIPDESLFYDDRDKFNRMVKERDDAIAKQAEWNAEQKIIQRERQRKEQETQQAQSQRYQTLTKTYVERGAQSGLTQERLKYNEDVMVSLGISADLAEELYADENGPQIVDYLVRNDDLLEELAQLKPTQAIKKIEREIRAKALSKKPATTQAPDPTRPSRSTNSIPDEMGRLAPGYTFY